MVLKIIITYLLLAFPTYSESLLIDPWFWIKGKNDKPTSTYIRIIFAILVSLMVDIVCDYGHWYIALGVTAFIHFTFFAPLVNWKLKKPIKYLGGNKYDEMISKIPFWLRFSLSLLGLIGFIILFELFKK